jgi:hypothetical protein
MAHPARVTPSPGAQARGDLEKLHCRAAVAALTGEQDHEKDRYSVSCRGRTGGGGARSVCERRRVTNSGRTHNHHAPARGTEMTMMMTMTAKSISFEMISILRRQASAMGDWVQVAICDLALNGTFDRDDYTSLSTREANHVASMTREEAYADVAATLDDV